MKKYGWIVGTGVSAVIAGFVAWLMWGPLLHWIWAQFPQDAAWYGFVKVGGILIVGAWGGVALPLIIFIIGMKISVEIF